MEVYFFPNGNTAVTENNRQITELQKSWFLLFVDFLVSKGIDPTKVNYHLLSRDAEVFKIPNGYNWRFRAEKQYDGDK